MHCFLLIFLLSVSPVERLRGQVRAQLEGMARVEAWQVLRMWGDGMRERHITQRALVLNHQLVLTGNNDLPRLGCRTYTEPVSLLHGVYSLPLTYHAGVFRFTSHCRWRERVDGRVWSGLVPCDGEFIADKHFNVLHIRQNLYPGEGRLVATAHISVVYRWVRLKHSYLLPDSIEMDAQFTEGDWYHSKAKWERFREFYATEPVVREY